MSMPSIEGLAVSFAEHDARTRERLNDHDRRLEALETRQTTLEKIATSVEVLANHQKVLEENQHEIKETVKAIAEKPVKRWEAIVEKILLAFVAAALAYIFPKVVF